MREKNKVYKIFVGKSFEKIPLWQFGISEKIILKFILHCKAMSYTELAQNMVFMLMNP
jgi:hypothetical protein